jgi:hypothetical protein
MVGRVRVQAKVVRKKLKISFLVAALVYTVRPMTATAYCTRGSTCRLSQLPVAEVIDPDWGDKVNSGKGCRTGPPSYMGWRAGTTTLCRSWLYPPSHRSMNSANGPGRNQRESQRNVLVFPFQRVAGMRRDTRGQLWPGQGISTRSCIFTSSVPLFDHSCALFSRNLADRGLTRFIRYGWFFGPPGPGSSTDPELFGLRIRILPSTSKKIWKPLWLLNDLLSLKTDVNVELVFCWHLESHWRKGQDPDP